jgi:hypothetical protein
MFNARKLSNTQKTETEILLSGRYFTKWIFYFSIQSLNIPLFKSVSQKKVNKREGKTYHWLTSYYDAMIFLYQILQNTKKVFLTKKITDRIWIFGHAQGDTCYSDWL